MRPASSGVGAVGSGSGVTAGREGGDRGRGVACGDQRRRGRRVDINGPQREWRDVLGDGDARSALRGRVGVGQREGVERGADSA